MGELQERRLGLYLHIPFCVRKCSYCDFLSAPADPETRKAYTDALCTQIQRCAAAMARASKQSKAKRDGAGFLYTVDTVFLGGGTPSLLSPAAVGRILDAVRKGFPVAKDAEISMECNPQTADEAALLGYRRAGVNRLSIGVQSANDSELLCLGRIHTWERFLETWKAARNAGFSNCNLDLMCALPGQTVTSLADTLRNVLELEPEHISVYSLIVEEGTPFFERYADGKGLPGEEEAAAMDLLVHRVMERAGYERYEISNYAKPGFACRHNLKYWSGGEYLGLGTGAVSFLRRDCGLFAKSVEVSKEGRGLSAPGLHIRSRCQSDTKEYIRLCKGLIESVPKSAGAGEESDGGRLALLQEETERLSVKDEIEEYAFLGLRKSEGISTAEFEKRFGIPFARLYGEIADRYLEMGLLRWEYDRVFLTERGLEVSNRIMADFLLE